MDGKALAFLEVSSTNCATSSAVEAATFTNELAVDVAHVKLGPRLLIVFSRENCCQQNGENGTGKIDRVACVMTVHDGFTH